MGYYNDQQRMFRHMEATIKKSGEGGIPVKMLLYEMTKSHPVGVKAVEARLELLKDINVILIYDDIITWNTKIISIFE